MKNIQLKILDAKLTENNMLPAYATESSAGLDLRACLKNPLILEAQQVKMISTGLAIFIEDPNIAGIILPRSGLGHHHGIVLGNLAGLIDADYQGELKISCWNRSAETFTIQPYERIAQLTFVPIIRTQFSLVNEFNTSRRSENGFGHTGKD